MFQKGGRNWKVSSNVYNSYCVPEYYHSQSVQKYEVRLSGGQVMSTIIYSPLYKKKSRKCKWFMHTNEWYEMPQCTEEMSKANRKMGENGVITWYELLESWETQKTCGSSCWRIFRLWAQIWIQQCNIYYVDVFSFSFIGFKVLFEIVNLWFYSYTWEIKIRLS